MSSLKCFFATCRKPVTHSVQRLWTIGGKTLPLLHCCDQHIPGSKAHLLKIKPPTLYRVEHMTDAE